MTAGGVVPLLHCNICPASYHVSCLPPSSRASCSTGAEWMCPHCKAGRKPLYGDIVWVKYSNYRWVCQAEVIPCWTTTTTVLRPFVRDCPGEPVPEETLTHPPSWSSSNLYQLLPSSTIHSILLVKIKCLAIFLHLFGLPLGLEPSTSYSIHFFTQSVSSFHSTCPYHHNLFCSSINIV